MQKSIFILPSIQNKLILLIAGLTGAALFFFASLSITTQLNVLKRTSVDNLIITSDAIGSLMNTSLLRSGKESARDILSSLKVDPSIEAAIIYDENNDVFASYLNSSQVVLPSIMSQAADGSQFLLQGKTLKILVSRPIVEGGNTIGRIAVLGNSHKLVKYLVGTASIILVSFVIVLAATIFAATRLHQVITKPLSTLARTARRISSIGDYSIRLEETGNDEIGNLITDFNSMVEAVQVREAELNEHRQNLELLVKERTAELRVKRDEALAAVRAKSEFLANMSHEIRTPMNGVIGVLSLLRDANLSDEHRRLLDTAIHSADSLLLIINDILDFSKIDAGRIDFERISFNLREIVEEVTELFVGPAKLKNLHLSCYIPVDLKCSVLGDPTRLRQIITNLVSNAIKFTDLGEVKIKVMRLGIDGTVQNLLFSIEDSGMGIPEEARSKLFEKFTQADGSTTRKYGGTGLGLSVCKQLVEMQGGEIGYKSSLGQGSLFWFTLPFELSDEDMEQPFNSDYLKGKRFLIIDDNATNRMILEQYLRIGNTEVYCCEGGRQGLATLEELCQKGRPVDAVLLDYHMPYMNGLDTAQAIRQKYQHKSPEIIMLASVKVSSDEIKRAGANAVLAKPVRQRELYSVLRHMPVTVRGAETPEISHTINVRLEGDVLLVDDEPINQKVALAILKKFGLNADLAVNGQEAVEKVQSTQYALVLMDIQMPVMSGYEATKAIRKWEAEEGRSPVPIVAMTAYAMESTKKECLALGMNDFLTKPIRPDILAERIKPWLKVQPLADWKANAESSVSTPAEGTDIWDVGRALDFVGGDKELLLELIELFLHRNTHMLNAIATAIAARDPLALRDAAHAYKGAINHFAAEDARQAAYQLEMDGKNMRLVDVEQKFGKLKETVAVLIEKLAQYLKTEQKTA